MDFDQIVAKYPGELYQAHLGPLFDASITFFRLTLEVRVFELCVHDGQAPVRRAILSSDSSCYHGLY